MTYFLYCPFVYFATAPQEPASSAVSGPCMCYSPSLTTLPETTAHFPPSLQVFSEFRLLWWSFWPLPLNGTQYLILTNMLFISSLHFLSSFPDFVFSLSPNSVGCMIPRAGTPACCVQCSAPRQSRERQRTLQCLIRVPCVWSHLTTMNSARALFSNTVLQA